MISGGAAAAAPVFEKAATCGLPGHDYILREYASASKGECAFMIDLHVHTSMSDGTYSPAEVVHMAYEKRLRAIAITDHDTVAGVEPALRAAEDFGVQVIPGVEMSTEWPEGIMHILGYLIDVQDAPLLEALDRLRSGRMDRIPRIVEKLRSCNVIISAEDVRREAVGGAPGRPHVAEIMMRHGYVRTIQEAFDRYLGKGAPAYVDKQKMSPSRAIRLIVEAGGLAVLAHPYSLNSETDAALEGILEELIGFGLAGIEAYYPRHTKPQEKLYLNLAKKLHLAVTGGTDFHGGTKPEIELGRIPGHEPMPYNILDDLRQARSRGNNLRAGRMRPNTSGKAGSPLTETSFEEAGS